MTFSPSFSADEATAGPKDNAIYLLEAVAALCRAGLAARDSMLKRDVEKAGGGSGEGEKDFVDGESRDDRAEFGLRHSPVC